MNVKSVLKLIAPIVAMLALTYAIVGTTIGSNQPAQALSQDPAQQRLIERGQYLVEAMSCNDCHTPWVMTDNGPAPDRHRLLSGHPEGYELGPPPQPSGGWLWSGAPTNTAFAGPWGTSYARNLTSDTETGLGWMPYELFAKAMRTGKHFGAGRPILPPMPWFSVAALSDEDLRSVHAYLMSTPPIKNKVPEPIINQP
jgi:mono/diheme cytochrome c family protein